MKERDTMTGRMNSLASMQFDRLLADYKALSREYDEALKLLMRYGRASESGEDLAALTEETTRWVKGLPLI